MSTFEVPILAIDDVYDHPNADRLSVVKVRGYEAICQKDEDGSHRFQKGELIVYVPEGAVVPAPLLKQYGFWNEEKNQGLLAGSQGNRVKAIRLRGMLSQGLVWKIGWDMNKNYASNCGHIKEVSEGDNVAEFFGIVKYEEPIPSSMSGQVKNCQEAKFDYDIENIKNYPEFLANDEVVVTEKLHGTFCRITYMPNINPDPELFGDGRVAIASKGLGARGLVFKNVQENDISNVYVRTLLQIKNCDGRSFLDALSNYGDYEWKGYTIHIMGEVFGRGVQDLHYGLGTPTFRAFDVAMVKDGKTVFLSDLNKGNVFGDLGLERVPVLYAGFFDRAKLDELCSGTTTLGEFNIREGIVITAVGDQAKRQADATHMLRPILKHVSPEYLTRKGGTELQ